MKLFANNASTTLASPISNSALSLTVATGDGAKFPNPTGGDDFNMTIATVTAGVETAIEIVKVTARSGDVMTIVRGQEGTTAVAHATGDYIGLRVTAAIMTAYETLLNQKNAASGYAGLSATYQIQFKNAAGTFTSLLSNANTAARNYTFPDKDMTVASLDTNTFTGAQVMSDQVVSRAMLNDTGYVFLDKGNSGTTAQTLDYTDGQHQKVTATGNHSFAFSNWPPSGNTGFLLMEATNYGAFTITPPTVNWVNPDGTTTTSLATHFTALAAVGGRSGFKSSGTDFILYWSRDAGTTVYGKFL
jgi:hypothetical protein